jgi:hypothetical protein
MEGVYIPDAGGDLTAQPRMHFLVEQTSSNEIDSIFTGRVLRGGVERKLTTLDFDTSDLDKMSNTFGIIILNGSDIVAGSVYNFANYNSHIDIDLKVLWNSPSHSIVYNIPAEIQGTAAYFYPLLDDWNFSGYGENSGVITQENRSVEFKLEYVSSSTFRARLVDTSDNSSSNGVVDSNIEKVMESAANLRIVLAGLPNDSFDEDGLDSDGLDINGFPLTPTFNEINAQDVIAEGYSLLVKVLFTRPLTASLSFSWSASGSGSSPAVGGTDFSPTSNTVSASAGDTSAEFSIAILSDSDTSEDEFTITLSSFSGNNFTSPSSNPTKVITITAAGNTNHFNEFGRWVTSNGSVEDTVFDDNGFSVMGFNDSKINNSTGTTLDANGFLWNGIHNTTGTPFDSSGLTWDRKTATQLVSDGYTSINGSSGSHNLSAHGGRWFNTSSTGITSSTIIGSEGIIRGNIASVPLGYYAGEDLSMLAGTTVFGTINSTNDSINGWNSSEHSGTRGAGCTIFGDINSIGNDFSDFIGSSPPTNLTRGAILFGNMPQSSTFDIWEYGQVWGNIPNSTIRICKGVKVYGCVNSWSTLSFCTGSPSPYVQQTGGC